MILSYLKRNLAKIFNNVYKWDYLLLPSLLLSLQSSRKTEPRRLSLTLLNDNDFHCIDINARTKRQEVGEEVCDYVSSEVWVYDPDKMAQVTWTIDGSEFQSRGWLMEWEMKKTMDNAE